METKVESISENEINLLDQSPLKDESEIINLGFKLSGYYKLVSFNTPMLFKTYENKEQNIFFSYILVGQHMLSGFSTFFNDEHLLSTTKCRMLGMSPKISECSHLQVLLKKSVEQCLELHLQATNFLENKYKIRRQFLSFENYVKEHLEFNKKANAHKNLVLKSLFYSLIGGNKRFFKTIREQYS